MSATILLERWTFQQGHDASAAEIRRHDQRRDRERCCNRRPFGWPVILEVLERIEFDFDDNGEPELPSMISDRDISKVVPQAPASVGV